MADWKLGDPVEGGEWWRVYGEPGGYTDDSDDPMEVIKGNASEEEDESGTH